MSSNKYEVLFNKEECKGYVIDSKAIKLLEEKWYGARENNKLVLDIVEIAYLLLGDRAHVIDHKTGDPINSFEDFVNHYYECLEEFFWPKLIVYKDLRDRGRRVRVLGEDKFLVRDKYGDLRLVVVLEEGSTRSVISISKNVESAMDNNLKLVYAIVSLQGDLTYYEVTRIDPKKD
ncbi:MAG: endonuclease [Thermoprotei archaeon]